MLTASFAVMLSASAAHATSVVVMRGEALVSHGDGYESIAGVAEVSAGDRVVAKAGSSVKVTFRNGCTLFLGMGMVFDVPSDPPCGGEAGAETTTGAVGDNSPSSTQDWSAGTQTTVAPDVALEPPQTNLMPYLLGAAAVGGISAAALAFSGDGGGSPPASP